MKETTGVSRRTRPEDGEAIKELEEDKKCELYVRIIGYDPLRIELCPLTQEEITELESNRKGNTPLQIIAISSVIFLLIAICILVIWGDICLSNYVLTGRWMG
jgi:hypothetical protein